MDLFADKYSPTEIAAFAFVPVNRVRKAIEHEIIRVENKAKLPLTAVVYLQAVRAPELKLTISARQDLFVEITLALSEWKATIEFAEYWTFPVSKVAKDVVSKVSSFEAWKSSLVVDSNVLGGEPVFPGTRLAVRNIGGQLERGESEEVLLEDYPYLSDEDLGFAPLFLKAYPRVGRPRNTAEVPGRRKRVPDRRASRR